MRKTFLVMSRLIDLFVDILPIDELGFKHVKLQSEGRPPYNPATLLKLYLSLIPQHFDLTLFISS